MSMEANPGAGEEPQVSDISNPGGSTDSPGASATAQDTSVDGGDIGDPSDQNNVRDYEKEAKHFQSLYDRDLGKLKPYLDRGVALDDIIKYAESYAGLVQHPEAGAAIQELARTGQWTPQHQQDNMQQQTIDEDEYLDPTVRALKDEIESLRGTVSSLQTDQSVAMRNQGQANFQGLTEKFMSDYEFSPDEHKEISQRMGSRLTNLLSTPDGQRQLHNMNDETFKMVFLPTIEPYLRDGIRRKLQNNAERIQGAATDAPLSVGTTGGEPDIRKFDPKSTNLRDGFEKALTDALERSGKLSR